MAVKDHLSDRLAELSRLVAGTGGTSPTHDFFARHFGLPGNPFPPPGIADATGENPPLRKRDVDTIINFIERGYTTGQSQFMVIKGEYGSGKTQALRYIEYAVNNYMNKGDHVARAIYIENPSLNVQELNRTILRALGQDAVKSYIWFPIYTMLLQDVQAQPQRFLDLRKNLLAQRGQRSRGRKQRSPVGIAEMGVKNAPAMNAPFDDVFNPQTILDYHTFLGTLVGKGWRREDVSPYLTTLLLEAVDLPNSVSLGQTFVALLLAANEASFLSWETLLGLTNTRATLPLHAPDFLKFLLRVMAVNGIVYVYMILDEFEEVSQTALLTARQRQDYLYTMRDVLNDIQQGLSVIIGISSPGWDALRVDGVPFADANHEIISLPRVDIAGAVKLVQFYLDCGREGTAYPQGQFSPFSRDLIAYVLDNFPRSAQRTPRNVVQFMHRLLNYAAEHGITALTPDVAQPLLAEFGGMKSGGKRPTRGRGPRDAQ